MVEQLLTAAQLAADAGRADLAAADAARAAGSRGRPAAGGLGRLRARRGRPRCSRRNSGSIAPMPSCAPRRWRRPRRAPRAPMSAAIERLRGAVREADTRLGGSRPADITGLMATLDAQLEAARGMQLARDQWELRAPAARKYRRSVTLTLRAINRHTPALEDVRAQAGPPASKLPSIIDRWRRDGTRLDRITPPADMVPVHALFRSAWEMGEQAFSLRLSAAASQRRRPRAAGLVRSRRRADAADPRPGRSRCRACAPARRPLRDHAPPHAAAPRAVAGRSPQPADRRRRHARSADRRRHLRAGADPRRWRAVAPHRGGSPAGHRGPTVAWPRVGPRSDLYRELFSRAPQPLALLSPFDREVLLGRLAREVEASGIEPPFALRPSLVAEMLALYDHVRRQARTVEDFDRNLRAELEPAVDTDRGAAQLLRQTAFLTAVFDGYEAHLASHGLLDEHRRARRDGRRHAGQAGAARGGHRGRSRGRRRRPVAGGLHAALDACRRSSRSTSWPRKRCWPPASSSASTRRCRPGGDGGLAGLQHGLVHRACTRVWSCRTPKAR